MKDIKPIETIYNGYRFRSRLEARWAVFFDAAGIKYEYEPEGFEHDGYMYLPDFYLPELGVYAEVKANREGISADVEKCMKMIYWGGPIKILVFLGQIPGPVRTGWWHFPALMYTLDGLSGHCEGVKKRWFFFFDSVEYDPDRHKAVEIVTGWISSATFKMWTNSDLSSKGDCEIEPYTYSWKPEWDSKEEWMDFTNSMAIMQNERTIKAYETARQARFEHGERPTI